MLPPFVSLTSESIFNIDFPLDKIISIITKLDSKKAHGFDGISAAMLKTCPYEIAIPLRLLYQKCILTGTFPAKWKHANIQSVHKKNSRQVKTNYRPISLLCICSKIFEKIIFDKLYTFLKLNNLITPNQSGFIPGDSTINQLLAITTEIYNSFEKVDETRALFLDLSKAFDKVWHPGLLFKLKQNGIHGNLLRLFENYLSDRKQRVVLNGIESTWEPMLSGVPQGSVLGPLLFLIYINDLTNNISANIKLFADDSSLFIKVLDVEIAHKTLEEDLDKISAWAKQWKMKFNPDITKQAVEVIFSNKYKKPYHPPISFDNIPVARVDSTKHLGLILDSKLSFREHILESIEKAKKGLSLMKFLSKHINRKTLVLTYTMHVRPHLEYGDIIFHNSAHYLMDAIESIQYQAGLIATGCWQKTNRYKLYNELGWESLSDRRHNRRLTNYHKIITGNSPRYLQNYILTSPPPPTSTQRYERTFFPYCYNSYSTLDPTLKSHNYNKFKSLVSNLNRPAKKSFFGVMDRHGLKLLTCLRVEHSDLREHRFNKKFNCPDPICRCGLDIESNEHYLLQCPLFTGPRCPMLKSIMDVLTKNVVHSDKHLCQFLLYGKNNLTHLENTNILNATIKYLKNSKRFKTLEAFLDANTDTQTPSSQSPPS